VLNNVTGTRLLVALVDLPHFTSSTSCPLGHP
jgi:hypothetical protein